MAVAATQRSASWSFWPKPCPGPNTPCAECSIRLGKICSRPDNLCSRYLIFQTAEPLRTPPSQPRAIAKLGDSDEGDDNWPAFKDWAIQRSQ
jgi:hypothetical protein